MLQQPLDAIVIVPVVLAEQHGREAVRREFPTLHQELQSAVVITFRRVIRDLFVVRVRAPPHQQPRQILVVRDSSRAVERALEPWLRLVVRFVKPRIRTGAGIEKRGRRAYKTGGACAIEPKVLRETERGERVPTARAAFRRCVCRIECSELADSGLVAEDSCRVNIAARDLRMRRQDRLSLIQRAVPDACLDEGAMRRTPRGRA